MFYRFWYLPQQVGIDLSADGVSIVKVVNDSNIRRIPKHWGCPFACRWNYFDLYWNMWAHMTLQLELRSWSLAQNNEYISYPFCGCIQENQLDLLRTTLDFPGCWSDWSNLDQVSEGKTLTKQKNLACFCRTSKLSAIVLLQV